MSAQLRELESQSSPVSDATPIVFVVDGDASVRESLKSLIQCAGWRSETFASAFGFLARPPASTPSCLVLDITLPNVSGLDLQRRIAAERRDMPVICITGNSDVPTTIQVMKAGAFEFLIKPFGDDVMLSALRQAIESSHTSLSRAAELRLLRDRYALLSRRERQVMALVVTGMLNKRVGGELGISEITVKAHRGSVMRKMKAESLADLVNKAARLRLASPPIR